MNFDKNNLENINIDIDKEILENIIIFDIFYVVSHTKCDQRTLI